MKTITIGMAHHTDYDGFYFSIQDLLKEIKFNGREDLLNRLEFIIVENDPESVHAKAVKNSSLSFGLGDKIRIIDFSDSKGTSATRNKIIEEARTDFVLVMDCHVLLCPVVETLDKLFKFIDEYPDTKNLYQGPLVHDNLSKFSTHFNNEWGSGMWGRWGSAWSCKCKKTNFSIINDNSNCKYVELSTQKEIKECNFCYSKFNAISYYGHETMLRNQGYKELGPDPEDECFEIFSQGLGLFFTSKEHWLGFNQHSFGFGGEECYIHEKYRKNGRRTICLPFLRWLHRFNRPSGVPYELNLENKIRNYLLEFKELGLDIEPVRIHFVDELKYDNGNFENILKEVNVIYGEK